MVMEGQSGVKRSRFLVDFLLDAVTGLVSLWNSGLLRFKHLVADDSGVYVCKATTNFYQKAKVYTLDVPVRCEPTLVYSVSCLMVFR